MNLGRRVLLFLFILLPVLLVEVYSYVRICQDTKDRIYEQRRSVVSLSEHVLQEKLGRISDLGLSFATRPLLYRHVDKHEWNEAVDLIERIPADFPFIDRVLITDNDGIIRAQTPEAPADNGSDLSRSDLYQGFIKTHKPYMSAIYLDGEFTHQKVAAYAVAIKNDAGIECGILVMQVKVSELLEWTKHMQAATSGILYVVDQNGILAINPQYPRQDTLISYADVPA